VLQHQFGRLTDDRFGRSRYDGLGHDIRCVHVWLTFRARLASR
jgi:hypothetical protein